MTQRKAKFIQSIKVRGEHPILVYQYRGIQYDVTDYGWHGGEPLSWQHRNAQAGIDQVLDHPAAKSQPENVDDVLDDFLNYFES